MAKNLDFKSCLIESIGTLNLEIPLVENINDDSDSLAIVALPGGTVTRSYYNGVKDKALPFEIRGKTKSPDSIDGALNDLSEHLSELETLNSKNGSFEFMDIRVSDEPYFEGAENDAYFFFGLGFTANITIL